MNELSICTEQQLESLGWDWRFSLHIDYTSTNNDLFSKNKHEVPVT